LSLFIFNISGDDQDKSQDLFNSIYWHSRLYAY